MFSSLRLRGAGLLLRRTLDVQLGSKLGDQNLLTRVGVCLAADLLDQFDREVFGTVGAESLVQKVRTKLREGVVHVLLPPALESVRDRTRGHRGDADVTLARHQARDQVDHVVPVGADLALAAGALASLSML